MPLPLALLNGPDVKMRVYRGNTLTLVFGPVEGIVDEIAKEKRREKNALASDNPDAQGKDDKIPTDEILLPIKDPDGKYYSPRFADYIHVEGSWGGVLDEYYTVIEYSNSAIGFSPEFSFHTLKVRRLGDKKPGDTKSDNSKTLKL